MKLLISHSKEKMYRILLTALFISILLNIIFIFQKNDSRNIGSVPPWEPFELESNLSLESIVKNGYRFGAMPCGQVQFYKTVADTTIQYEVGIDCKTYSKEKEWIYSFFNSEPEPLWERKNKDDPYYPFDFEEVKNCYQGINWRIYRFKIKKLDREEVREFINKKGCRILTDTEKWVVDEGGSLVVFNPNNSLYFFCTISKENYKGNRDSNWVFKILSDIPYIDSKRIIFEAERRERQELYYKSKYPILDIE